MYVHFDADAFFASVLQRKYPQYQNKPLIALGMGGGCVISASYECKAKKVRTGMRLSEAKLLCPEAIAIPSDFTETALASKQIQNMLYNLGPILEQASIDEWYMDLKGCTGGVPKDLSNWAQVHQTDITKSTAINVSFGIAPTKLLAKMASDYKKPKGIAIVVPNVSSRALDEGSTLCQTQSNSVMIDDFLKDRPCAAIPGIGGKRQSHAQAFQWNTAYDFAHADAETVQRIFGRPGLEMQQELQGKPLSGITLESAPPKSISRCRSFKNTKNEELIFAYLCHHLSYTIIKLRRHQLMCKWIGMSIRNHEFKRSGKDYKLPLPMDTEEQLLPYVQRMFKSLYKPGHYYTQISLTLGMFSSKAAKQFNLFEDPELLVKDDKVQHTLDELHNKLGRDSIMRGSALPIKSGVKRGVPIIE